MEALRKIITLKDNILKVILPERFRAKKIEIIVIPADENSTAENREQLLLRYNKQYAHLHFDIKNLKYNRDELYDR